MNRKICYWKLRSVELQLGEKTLIMGILNVTPDSFSDGGEFSDPDRAYARALELEEQGADFIDIGAESTRPGSQRVSAEEEWRRLVPVLKRLRDKLTIPISLDTYKAETAERAFEYGIEIINDPSGLTFDADLAKTVANANAGLILNHMRGTPETWARLPPLPDAIGSIARDLEATVNRARRAGVERSRIAIDPGLGFGKRREQNSEIIAHLGQLAGLDCPILVGPSRKSFLAQSTGPETLYATAAAVAISILNGAHIVRVHDVKEMRAVVQIADDVARASGIKQAAEDARQAAERPVPRRAARENEDKPRSVTPPVSKAVPRVQPAVEVVPEAAAPEAVTEPVIPPVAEERIEEPRRDVRKEVRKETRPAAKPYSDRPPRREFSDRPPRRDSSGGSGDRRPPARRDSADRPPRREFGDRPPRREFSDRPPRRDFGGKPPAGDRPQRREYSDRPANSDRPRRDFAAKPPRRDSGPPRREFGSGRPQSGDRPPRRDFAGGRPPGGDRSPRRDSEPPRGKSAGNGGSRPPARPFRKRP